jgi:hypothetical protein
MNETIKILIEFTEWKHKMKLLINAFSLSKLGNNNEFETKYPDLYRDLQRFYKKLIPHLDFSRGCNSCWNDRYFEITQISIIKLIEAMNVKHKLKEGVVYQHKGSFYSNKSPHLTNEIAQEIYDKNPGLFEFFDVDWKGKEVTVASFQKEVEAKGLKEFFDIVPEVEKEVEVVAEVEAIVKNETKPEPKPKPKRKPAPKKVKK